MFKRKLNHLLVTGGAGFIGSAFIRYLLNSQGFQGTVLNYDILSYAADLNNLQEVQNDPRYSFVQGDVCDGPKIERIFDEKKIDAVIHFAAETHVDRSIASVMPFLEANVKGTLSLLQALQKFPHIHFHHVSTDEVYGALGNSGTFSETSLYRPNSPYSASKAASDHFVRAFAHTYGLSTTISHCSNNYGPGQYPEKFIPLMILNCFKQKPLPVYGKGQQIRDWLYVEDHAEAIWTILNHGKKGETYDIGAYTERTNLALLEEIIDLLGDSQSHSLIQFVPDRPGHDFRYAINASKIFQELGWRASTSLKDGLKKTIDWYTEKYGYSRSRCTS